MDISPARKYLAHGVSLERALALVEPNSAPIRPAKAIVVTKKPMPISVVWPKTVKLGVRQAEARSSRTRCSMMSYQSR